MAQPRLSSRARPLGRPPGYSHRSALVRKPRVGKSYRCLASGISLLLSLAGTPPGPVLVGDRFSKDDGKERAGALHHPKVDAAVEFQPEPGWRNQRRVVAGGSAASANSPSSRARAVTCVRLAAPSFSKMWVTCFLTAAIGEACSGGSGIPRPTPCQISKGPA